MSLLPVSMPVTRDERTLVLTGKADITTLIRFVMHAIIIVRNSRDQVERSLSLMEAYGAIQAWPFEVNATIASLKRQILDADDAVRLGRAA